MQLYTHILLFIFSLRLQNPFFCQHLLSFLVTFIQFSVTAGEASYFFLRTFFQLFKPNVCVITKFIFLSVSIWIILRLIGVCLSTIFLVNTLYIFHH